MNAPHLMPDRKEFGEGRWHEMRRAGPPANVATALTRAPRGRPCPAYLGGSLPNVAQQALHQAQRKRCSGKSDPAGVIPFVHGEPKQLFGVWSQLAVPVGVVVVCQHLTHRLPAHLEFALRRFYFHLRAGEEITPDEEGTELPDLSAAKGEAALAARELLADEIKGGKRDVPEAFVIADEAGQPLAIVPLATVLPRFLKK